MPASAPRILDVGQCGVDGPRIGRFLRETLHAQVDRADTKDDALARAKMHQYNLVLVNRILNYDKSPGLDVIAAFRQSHPNTPIMLVSDRQDAQAQATQLGALQGFGKSQLETPETEELLKQVLNAPI